MRSNRAGRHIGEVRTMNKTYLFTSESVSEGHPDKIADQISDAILDAYLQADPRAKVACETMVTDGTVIVAGELFSENADLSNSLEDLVRSVIKDIGYVNPKLGFDYRTFKFQNRMHTQSPNIRECVENNGTDCIGAGDQGLMFGHATVETPELMPLPILLAHRLAQRQAEVRKNGTLPWLGPDAKSQITVRYRGDRPERIEKVVLSTQHSAAISNEEIETAVIKNIIRAVIPEEMLTDDTSFLVNPSGRFEIGGPEADTGLTGRKIIVDTYGGSCPHGGGAFSGKDPTKVDRSAAYAARHISKNLVAAGIADRCTIQLAYAIGQADPVSVAVDFHGTGRIGEAEATEIVTKVFDLTPGGIIRNLDLRKPIYRRTAAYGHFGRELPEFTWEKTDKTQDINR